MSSSPSSPEIPCRRCGKPLQRVTEALATFEGMHWLCFHLEYEHHGDPDVACEDPSCPWRQIRFYRDALSRAGVDPDDALEDAIGRYYSDRD